MAFDLNAVRPRPDGKYSPELHRWLRREGRNKCGVFQRNIDPIFGEPTTAGVWSPSSILIGFADDDGWILGNSLREIVLARARQRWAIPIGTEGYRVITDEFWAEYVRDGRCAWDREHRMHMVGDGNRWHYHSCGRGRRCRWCGAEQVSNVERRVEVVETVREVWAPYRASVPAAVTWPRGSMGEAV